MAIIPHRLDHYNIPNACLGNGSSATQNQSSRSICNEGSTFWVIGSGHSTSNEQMAHALRPRILFNLF